MKTILFSLALVMIITTGLQASEQAPDSPTPITATTLDGKIIPLDTYAGSVLLIVNVASRCGFTKQYRELQQIHEKYAERGLVVLGFPCNQFGRQEPGTKEEIMAFCEANFGVTFTMFEKIDVNGEQAHPLYKRLTSEDLPIEDTGPVKWNFEKFLIDRNGTVIARFRSRVKPNAPEVISAIENALGE